MNNEYVPEDFKFDKDLDGLSARLLAEHIKLYQGYVKKSNEIQEKIKAADKSEANASYSYISELKRQETFAVNGMKLHEAYFGHLKDELMRAVRLVVDTGIHAKGWSREEAMLYMQKNLGYNEARAKNQIERYMVLPAQALSYKIGARKILELRSRAQQALGEKFSLPKFHEIVIGDGTLPLPILEAQVDRWIAKGK